MADIERNVTAALVIEEMCRELRMTEEQLLIHLVIENVNTLSPQAQRRVAFKAKRYYERGVYQITVKKP